MLLPLLPQGTLDYTGLTRDDMLLRLQALFSQINPEWDDYSTAHPENLLLEGMVFIGDLIRGTMEERVRQHNWATITDRLAAIRKARSQGFTIPAGSAATLTGTFTLALVATVRIPIYEGTRIITKDATDPKAYRTTADTAIEVGQNSIDVNCEQAELVSVTFDSSLEPNIEIALDKSPYIEDSVTVSAANGTYNEVTTFAGVNSTTCAFIVFADDDYKIRVRFGNGINGAIPQGTINVSYKIGGGVAGEVAANAQWFIQDNITDELSNPVTLTFSNAAASSVGVDPMSVEEARVRAPLSLALRERSVIDNDFTVAATSVAGIARAILVTSNVDSAVAENTGRLEVIAYGSQISGSSYYTAATPTQAKLDEIAALFTEYGAYPSVMRFTVNVVAGLLEEIDIAVRIYKSRNYTAAQVRTNINAAIANFFAIAYEDKTPNTDMNFGAFMLNANNVPDYKLSWSSVFNAIRDANGVRMIEPSSSDLLLNGIRASYRLQPNGFPVPGTITVYDMDQSGAQI